VTYGLRATGVVLGSAGGGTATLINDGSIGALSDRAVASPPPSFFATPSPFPTSNNTSIINNSDGTITGFVQLVGGNNSILNDGTFNLRHFADTTGVGVRDTVRVAITDLGTGPNNTFTNNGTLALANVTGATTLDSTGQYLPLSNPNNTMALGGPLQGHLIGVNTFTNSGIIDLQQNPAAGDVLVITGASPFTGAAGPGTFISNGGTLKLDTVLNQGGTATQSDTLVVDGTSVGPKGATNLAIRNAGGAGALTVGDGILVVEVKDPTRSANNAFKLAGLVSAGPYNYGLFYGGVNGSNPGDWFLRSMLDCALAPSAPVCQRPTPPPGFRPETSLYPVLPSLSLLYGRMLLDTLHERVGEEEHLRGRSDISGQPFDNGGWARVIGQLGQRDGDQNGIFGSGPKFDYGFSAFQAGHDVYRVEHIDGSRDHVGFYAAAGFGSSDVTHITGVAAGEDQFTATSLGGYWTHFGPQGWYLDGILQGTWYDMSGDSHRGLGTLKTHGAGFASSLEAGYPFRLSGGWLIEPQAQVVYQDVSLSDSADSAAAVRFQDVESLAARFGVRIARTWALDAGSNPRLVTAWVRPNFWREFNGNPITSFSSDTGFVPFHADLGGNWAEINAGVSYTVNRTTEFYANTSYQTGLDGRSFAYNGKAGFRLNW
jgi:autotransporter family porin